MPMGKLHEGKVWKLSIYLDKKYLHNPPLSYGVREGCLVYEVFSLAKDFFSKDQTFHQIVTGRVVFGGKGERVNESIVVL